MRLMEGLMLKIHLSLYPHRETINHPPMPESATEPELAEAEAELKALRRHAFGIVEPESR
jgi:hypothetical protein